MKHLSITCLSILLLFLMNGLVLGQSYPVYCGVGFDLNLRAKIDSSNFSNLSSSQDGEDTCGLLFQKGRSLRGGSDDRKGYDTLRYAMEQCANYKYSPSYFLSINGDVANMSNDTLRFVDYREWLKKVLYLNTQDPNYYCADVQSIMFSMQYFSGRGYDYNGSLAILKYVIESGKCPKQFFPNYDSLWPGTRRDQYHNWRDSVHDSIATPFDTTLPSIESLNLQILYGPQYIVHEREVIDAQAIKSFTASKNPFASSTELQYSLRSTAAVRLEIYDALGKEVYSDQLGFRSPGDYTLKLSTALWASGSYYARLSSLVGGVVSIKLVRE